MSRFGGEISYLVDNVVNGGCIETSSAGNITQFWTLFIFIQYFELGFHQKRFSFHWSRFWIFRFLFLQKFFEIFGKIFGKFFYKIRTFGKPSCPFLGGERSGCSGRRAITEVCWICFLAKSFSFLISTYSAFKFLRNYLGNFLTFSVGDFFCWDFFEFHMSDNFQIIFILFGWILFTLLSDWNRSNSIPNRDRKISTAIIFF